MPRYRLFVRDTDINAAGTLVTADQDGAFTVASGSQAEAALIAAGATLVGQNLTAAQMAAGANGVVGQVPAADGSLQVMTAAEVAATKALVSGDGIPAVTNAMRTLMATARQDISTSTPPAAPTLSVSAGDTPVVASPVYIDQGSGNCDTSVPVVVGAVYPDTQVTFPRYYSDGNISATPRNTGNVASYFLETDEAAPELRFKNLGVRMRVWWTEGGRRYYGGDIVPTYDAALHYLRINFGSRSLRTVEVETAGGCGKWAIGPTSSYFRPYLPDLTAFVFGDSITEGTGASIATLGWAAIFAKLCGLQKTYVSGLGGTGYGATTGSRANMLGRLQTDCLDLLPSGKCVIFHANGINDTLAHVQTNAPLIFDAIRAAKPAALQVVFDAFSPRSVDNVAKNAALAAAVAARPGMIYVPTTNEIWGTGSNGSGTGNSSWVISSDNTHPTVAGHDYLARARADLFARALGI